MGLSGIEYQIVPLPSSLKRASLLTLCIKPGHNAESSRVLVSGAPVGSVYWGGPWLPPQPPRELQPLTSESPRFRGARLPFPGSSHLMGRQVQEQSDVYDSMLCHMSTQLTGLGMDAGVNRPGL